MPVRKKKEAKSKAEPQARGDDLFALVTDLGRLGSLRDPILNAEELGFTPPQIHTVMWLGIDGPLPMGTIAQRIHTSVPSMTGVTDRLERDEIVTRARDLEDRRVIHLRLTPKGQELFAKLRGAIVGRLDTTLALLGEDDAHALVGILSRLRDALRARTEIAR